jgi:hypothetical protein
MLYYGIAFGWTWVLTIGLIFSGAVDDISNPSAAFIIVGLLSNISPSIAAFIVAIKFGGHPGVEALKNQFKRKVSLEAIAVTMIIVPIVTILTTIISNFTVRA